ncbi:putative random slug protein 5-like [Sesbania bispinosa]|nr:putative random slug protein 5-like [Sesbania bispinosa]
MAQQWLDHGKVYAEEGCARRNGGSGDVVGIVTWEETMADCSQDVGGAYGGERWFPDARLSSRELHLGVNVFLLRRQTQNQQENGSSYQDAKGVTKVVGDEARGSGTGMR